MIACWCRIPPILASHVWVSYHGICATALVLCVRKNSDVNLLTQNTLICCLISLRRQLKRYFLGTFFCHTLVADEQKQKNCCILRASMSDTLCDSGVTRHPRLWCDLWYLAAAQSGIAPEPLCGIAAGNSFNVVMQVWKEMRFLQCMIWSPDHIFLFCLLSWG